MMAITTLLTDTKWKCNCNYRDYCDDDVRELGLAPSLLVIVLVLALCWCGVVGSSATQGVSHTPPRTTYACTDQHANLIQNNQRPEGAVTILGLDPVRPISKRYDKLNSNNLRAEAAEALEESSSACQVEALA